jgi:hypothetical protein
LIDKQKISDKPKQSIAMIKIVEGKKKFLAREAHASL